MPAEAASLCRLQRGVLKNRTMLSIGKRRADQLRGDRGDREELGEAQGET